MSAKVEVAAFDSLSSAFAHLMALGVKAFGVALPMVGEKAADLHRLELLP